MIIPPIGHSIIWKCEYMFTRFMHIQVKKGEVSVSIYNYQLYRHIERPGWRLGWTWPNDEVIWDMRGAETTNQGNCSKFKGDNIPHCCEKSPTIVDLLPGTPYNMQTKNCCRGGVLSSHTQDRTLAMASFQMSMESANISSPATGKPSNFTLGIPGYTCSNATVVAPSKFQFDKQRTTQALSESGACLFQFSLHLICPENISSKVFLLFLMEKRLCSDMGNHLFLLPIQGI
ncbi:hypothetical protein C4D60_Mb04t34200 [Musa balbisiana]|uniref:COBRA-like protein n=1 Tax=Musa balbisiana TaxID=52838 RepID=A0A4S8KGS9_MUSBA|nr:hypothetical protein C4D60_Mb04t34200 [Musa balbisiana]